MDKTLVTKLLEALLVVLNPELIKAFLDKGLDVIENAVMKSPSKWDDMFVIPLCDQVRKALNIPDDDDLMDPIEVDNGPIPPPELPPESASGTEEGE